MICRCSHSMAMAAPRPSAMWRSTKYVVALNTSAQFTSGARFQLDKFERLFQS